jgi:hypothetical protein
VEPLIALGVMVVFMAIGVASHRTMMAKRQENLRNLALSAGLTDLSDIEANWISPCVTAAAGRLSVRLQDRPGGNDGRTTTITIVDPKDGMQGLSLTPETPTTQMQKRLLGAREIEIGDEPFDAEFFVGGQPSKARALLDAQTRGLLRSITPAALLRLADGTLLAVSLSGLTHGGVSSLAPVLASLVEAARRMTSAADTAERLAHNALKDPVTSVRLQNLLVLLREFWGPSTRETLRAACKDVSPEIRLRAAAAIGSDGLPVLLQLARDHTLDDVWQAEAVKTLGRRLSHDQAEAILTQALRSLRGGTAAACLHVLGGHGSAGVGVLMKVLAVESDFLAAAAARALGVTRAAAAEATLVAALKRDGDETRCAAAEALGHVGTAAAVLPLKEAAERHPRDRALGRATRQAVAEIHSRLGTASPGQLSLAAADAGQISLVETEAGQLSFPAAEAGQLSLPAAEPGRLSLAGPGSNATKPSPKDGSPH